MLSSLLSRLFEKWSVQAWAPKPSYRHRFFFTIPSYLVWLVLFFRRGLYRFSFFSITKLPVPVIVVGNITVGGAGKTPLVIQLVSILKKLGYSPGIVSRGYRGSQSVMGALVTPEALSDEVGDEPLLLAQLNMCPVAIGVRRGFAAQLLLEKYPYVNVIISDDGLQHYKLNRDLEICVLDKRGVGNGSLFPLGALRESVERLAQVNAVVFDSAFPCAVSLAEQLSHSYPNLNYYSSETKIIGFRSLAHPDCFVSLQEFKKKGVFVQAVAGIGYPEQFFTLLRREGYEVESHSFPDHHPYQFSDFSFDNGLLLLMTDKDAVKCRSFAKDHWWSVSIVTEVSDDFEKFIQEKLSGSSST